MQILDTSAVDNGKQVGSFADIIFPASPASPADGAFFILDVSAVDRGPFIGDVSDLEFGE